MDVLPEEVTTDTWQTDANRVKINVAYYKAMRVSI
jgi:hypothetical protein